MKIDLVVPAIARDLTRLEILVRSLKRFWHIEGRRVLAIRKHEMPLFQHFAPFMELVAKEDLIGPQPYSEGMSGWYRQQMVKVAAANLFEGVYVAIDSDCFAAKDLTWDTFVKDGKLPMIEHPWNEGKILHYRGSARALDIDQIPERAWTWRPPFFFHSEILRNAISRMEEQGLKWTDVLCKTKNWGEVLLYHLALLRENRQEKLHYLSEPVTHEFIRHPHVDIEGDFQAWDVDETFSGKYMFGVVHSNTKIDPARVADKLKGRFE